MPRYPESGKASADITRSVYSGLANKLANHSGEVYPLHIGDTWLEPAEGSRMQDIKVADHPGMHRYAPPQGMKQLIDRIVERTRKRTHVATERQNILVSAGATGALGAVAGAILNPGDEVLLVAPYWPLINGIVKCFHGVPISVPIIGNAQSASDAVKLLELRTTPRTVALYISSPNNPTGIVLPPAWIEAFVHFATENNLWIMADEVYEDYVYEGEHVYGRSLDAHRTFSVHSFSKAFGMAGNRCGYVVGPANVMGELLKVSTHSFYSTPTASQIAAARALDGSGDRWIHEVAPQYRQLGIQAAKRLGVDPPQGSTFLFLDVEQHLDEDGLRGFLERCANRGLFIAPGPSFGPYPNHVRLCFTCAPPEVVHRGVDLLAEIMGR